MKMMKKSSIVVGLLLGFVSNGYTMDAPQVKQNSFGGLVGDAQGIIILNLIQVSDTLEQAVGKIKTLALQNAELTTKINETGFCLQLIKTLAKRFGRSDEKAARALGTKEAGRRLGIQEAFVNLCKKDNVSENELAELYNKGVDIRFTTENAWGYQSFPGMPILHAVVACNVSAVKFLLDKESDINNVDSAETTALSIAIRVSCKNRVPIVKMFLERGLSIHKDGSNRYYSALEYAIHTFKNNEDADIKAKNKRFAPSREFRATAQRMDETKEIIKLLLEAGADPEDKLVQDNLPDIKDEEVVAMINNAVAKKYAKK
jgi:hypothetical protein